MIDDIFGAITTLEHFLDKAEVYIPNISVIGGSINTALAPVRNKLIKDKNITVIGNTCAAARIYHFTDIEYKSPFMSVIIKPEDYVKICTNLEKY